MGEKFFVFFLNNYKPIIKFIKMVVTKNIFLIRLFALKIFTI